MHCQEIRGKEAEFIHNGIKDVDYVLTTQELGRMIEEMGLNFCELEPESFNLPFGFKTGAGVIFGNSGGVTEAVLRYVVEKLTGEKRENYEFKNVRGENGIREVKFTLADREFSMAVVSGLGNARHLLEKIKVNEVKYDFVEVMACPGGCVGGAGQPVFTDVEVRRKRTKGIYENDRMLELHKSQDNPYIVELYNTFLKEVGGEKSHALLHTHYKSRKRIVDEDMQLSYGDKETGVEVNVCFGTSCFIKGSQKLLRGILDYINANGLKNKVNVSASFCFESCERGPVARIGNRCSNIAL